MHKKIMIAGLGNPGKQYTETRHNIGFKALDELVFSMGIAFNSDKKCIVAEYDGVIFIKPLEFMNLSGGCVSRYMKQNGIHIQDLLVLHDEIDLAFGDIRKKEGGGHAGHNGLRDIIDKTGSRDFHRIRIGVGRPAHPDFSVADYVLSRFHAGEVEKIDGILKNVADLCKQWIMQKLPELKI